MSQSGKVLHLYVEVRSAPDQSGGKGEGEGLITPGLSGQDNPAELLSQLTSQNKASAGHRLVQDCAQNQSPSKHSVSFQFQQTNSSQQSPRVTKRWSSPCHNTNSSPGKVTTRYTPHNCQGLNNEDTSDGKRSVVTFSYVEKSNVKAVDSPQREERVSHFRKRLSDPVWSGSPNSSCSSSPYRSPAHQQYFSRQAPALDPIGRAATQRAVEEFGSPLLRIKLAHALENRESLPYRSPRCQSWAGSPLQCQKVCKNSSQQMCSSHSKSHVKSQSPLRQLTSSATTERHFDKGSSILGNNTVEGMNQLSESKLPSPAHSPEVARRLAEEATKVSSILTEARGSSLHNALGDSHSPASSAQQCKMNIPLNEQLTPTSDSTDSHQPQNCHSHKTNCDTQPKDCHDKYQHQSSPRCSPAIPSRSVRPAHTPTEVSSPVRDPRLSQLELRAPNTPTLHRYQPPQYTGDIWSPDLDLRGDFEKGDCTELSRRIFINQNVEEAPVSWTSRQQWGNYVMNSPRPSPESGFVSNNETPTPLPTQPSQKHKPLSPKSRQKRAEQRRREILLLGPVALDSPDEDEGCDEEGKQGDEAVGAGRQQRLSRDGEHPGENGGTGGSSRSSSGITGSLADRDCVSPESSQSSHHSNETGPATSGIQVCIGEVTQCFHQVVRFTYCQL